MLDTSIEYEQTTSSSHKKKHGQFFTNDYLKEELFNSFELSNTQLDILEPSSGSGEFINYINNNISYNTLDGYEIDPVLYDKTKDMANIFHEDFLLSENTKKYDLIVGNPPYFEIKKGTYNLDNFSDVIYGRVNIYTLFIKKSIELLKPNGILSFVIPISLASGAYFKNIRKYIVENANIISLKKYFDNNFLAEQSVMIITLKKECNNGNYIVHNGEDVLFTDKYNEVKTILDEGSTLKELGYKVTTGNVVGNVTTKDNNGNLLVWADNIKNNIFEHRKKESNHRHQYIQTIENTRRFNTKVIVCNRIVGKVGSAKLNACIIDKKDFYIENHLNVIEPVDPKVTIEELFVLLLSKETNTLINMIIGNTQLSKVELETLLTLRT